MGATGRCAGGPIEIIGRAKLAPAGARGELEGGAGDAGGLLGANDGGFWSCGSGAGRGGSGVRASGGSEDWASGGSGVRAGKAACACGDAATVGGGNTSLEIGVSEFRTVPAPCLFSITEANAAARSATLGNGGVGSRTRPRRKLGAKASAPFSRIRFFKIRRSNAF
ncbi:MAG TPA: hypothetical protein VHV51_03620, partial [Polyangiaceae bacterium]|nr:hypothetical protein [Polyangiaceae bacterium]